MAKVRRRGRQRCFIVMWLGDYDDGPYMHGVYSTRRRAANALKRQGYKQYPNPDVWKGPKGHVDLTIYEMPFDQELGAD